MQGQSLAPLLLEREGWEPRPVILDEFELDRETGELCGTIEVIDERWAASLFIDPRPDASSIPLRGHHDGVGDKEAAWNQRPQSVPRLLLYDLWNDPRATACTRNTQIWWRSTPASSRGSGRRTKPWRNTSPGRTTPADARATKDTSRSRLHTVSLGSSLRFEPMVATNLLLTIGLAVSGVAGQSSVEATPKLHKVADEVDLTGSVSPDGGLLFYVDWTTGDLAVRDLRIGTSRRLTDKGSWSESGAFSRPSIVSPNGEQVAYGWSNPDGFSDLRVIGLRSSVPRIVYRDEGVAYIAPQDWSPDGKRVLFASDRRGTLDAFLLRVSDGKRQGSPELIVLPTLGLHHYPLATEHSSTEHRDRSGARNLPRGSILCGSLRRSFQLGCLARRAAAGFCVV